VKPNIVLITVDCWRGDHIGLASNARANTPCIDKLAAQSHYFSDAHTCGGWTKIAMTSLFSSTHSSMYGFTQGKLNAQRPNLADELSTHGYNTAGFTTNLVCGRSGGFERGFKSFIEPRPLPPKGLGLNRKRKFERLAAHPIAGPMVSKLAPSEKPFYPTTDAQDLVTMGLEWLDQDHSEPYFLWLHFMDLHWPYRSSSRPIDGLEFTQMWQDREHWKKVRELKGKYYPGDDRANRWQQLYCEETQALDKELGRLFDTLSQRPDWQDTVLCLTSDHGEEFYEHGTWAHSWNQLHRQGTHVPLILKTPGQTTSSTRTNPVSQLDIAPTLLTLAGIETPTKMLGQDLLGSPEAVPIISEMHGHSGSHRYRLSIKHNGYHYIYDGDNNTCALYSLSESEDSTENRYSKRCSTSNQFDKLRLQHVSRGALDMLKGKIVIGEDELSYDLDDDPAVIERLRALGYMD
jgi:arylsulfatase A-like enzyme